MPGRVSGCGVCQGRVGVGQPGGIRKFGCVVDSMTTLLPTATGKARENSSPSRFPGKESFFSGASRSVQALKGVAQTLLGKKITEKKGGRRRGALRLECAVAKLASG